MNINNLKSKNILVTGGRAPVTLHLLRLLKKQGHNIYIAESNKEHICKHSNMLSENFIVPKPRQETTKYIEALINIIKLRNIDILIPTCEEVFFISKYLNELSKYCTVFCEESNKLKSYHSKSDFITLLNNYKILTPKTITVTSIKDLEKIIKDINYDFVLKPVFSRFSSKVIIRKYYEKEIPVIDISENNPWVIQEFIKGKAFCTYTISHNGNINAYACYESIFTAGKGASITFQHVEYIEIFNWINRFVKLEKFTGQIAFDFIISENGDIYPLECNPRATSGLHLFTNFEEIDKAFFNVNEKIIFPKISTKYTISIAMLIYGMSSIKSFRDFKRWLNLFLTSKDVTFKLNDIKPFFYQFYIILKLFFESKNKKVSILEITTNDIEWNGE